MIFLNSASPLKTEKGKNLPKSTIFNEHPVDLNENAERGGKEGKEEEEKKWGRRRKKRWKENGMSLEKGDRKKKECKKGRRTKEKKIIQQVRN